MNKSDYRKEAIELFAAGLNSIKIAEFFNSRETHGTWTARKVSDLTFPFKRDPEQSDQSRHCPLSGGNDTACPPVSDLQKKSK